MLRFQTNKPDDDDDLNLFGHNTRQAAVMW